MPNTLPSYSFRNKIREEIYKRRIMLKDNSYDAVFSLDVKSIAYEFAKKFDVLLPRVYYRNSRLEDVSLSSIETSFVLKPEQSHSSLGVSLVHFLESDDGYFLELLSNKRMTLNEIKDKSYEVMYEKKLANKWMVEELVYPDDGGVYAVDDWKFYCFYGKVGLILQKRKCLDGTIEYKLYDENLEEAKNTGKYIGSVNSDLPLSPGIMKMQDIAKRISLEIPKPFIRVDLYSSLKGVYFGELTPYPGGFSMFWKGWDERLGKMWLDSQERLDRDFRSGVALNLYKDIYNIVKNK